MPMNFNDLGFTYRKVKKYLWVYDIPFPIGTSIGHKDSHGLFHYKNTVHLVRWDNCSINERWRPIKFTEYLTLVAPKNKTNWSKTTAIARHFLRLAKI